MAALLCCDPSDRVAPTHWGMPPRHARAGLRTHATRSPIRIAAIPVMQIPRAPIRTAAIPITPMPVTPMPVTPMISGGRPGAGTPLSCRGALAVPAHVLLPPS